MNFLSPEAIVENAKYKRDKEPSDFQTIPYKTLVADNFEQSMKKYLSNPNIKHYSSAYTEDLGLIQEQPSKENYISGGLMNEHLHQKEAEKTIQSYPAIKGINTNGYDWKTNVGKYEYTPAEIPNNNCGKKFKELTEKDNPKIEKGISYPENTETFKCVKESFNIGKKNFSIISIIIIIILIAICFKMYVKIIKIKNKNKILKMQIKQLKHSK